MHFGVPISFFNGVAMAQLDEDCDAIIAQTVEEMNAYGMPWSWQVGPTSTPFDLKERLTKHGMVFGYEMPIMAVEVADWKPSATPKDLDIVPVANGEDFERWSEVAQVAFGLPKTVFDVLAQGHLEIGFDENCDVRNFVGLVDGDAVTCGTVFYNSGVAGVFTIGTLPDSRGHGYGGAITEACLADARRRRFDTAFLQSSKMGYPVYQRLGFRDVCKLAIFVPEQP
jgi:ribosomal protein S18 acetylase RimI-like enzyme